MESFSREKTEGEDVFSSSFMLFNE